MIDVLRTVREVRLWVAALRREGKSLALVPTMGFLHEGHLSLVREGARRCDACAATVFVNPAQFGPNEDLVRYPRDEAGDLAKCEEAGASLVWAPPLGEVYPAGYQTYVEVTSLQQGCCGASRPGHFRGVATVVAKLFNLFRPDVALFGEKDFQQLQVIRTMARDLDSGVEVVGLPTVREPDGLALSSRNAYLSAEDRQKALGLSRALAAAARTRAEGELDPAKVVAAARGQLAVAGVMEDYVALVDPESLRPVQTLDRPARLLLAGFLGRTRLIDNAAIG